MGPEILKHLNWCDEVWHAGDIGQLKVTDSLKKLKPLRAVYGNIDGEKFAMSFHCTKNLVWKASGSGSLILGVIPTVILKIFAKRLKRSAQIYLSVGTRIF